MWPRPTQPETSSQENNLREHSPHGNHFQASLVTKMYGLWRQEYFRLYHPMFRTAATCVPISGNSGVCRSSPWILFLVKWSEVTSVVSDSVRPHRRQPNRLPHPWDSPGENTGVGCHCLLQCMKVKSESEVSQSSDSLRPHGLQPSRLIHPWDFPGKSTGVGCHCLLRFSS